MGRLPADERTSRLIPPLAQRLALEHLTAPSASPKQIVELAASQGWRSATVLVAPFGPYPQTGGIDLISDAAARREVRSAARREGVALAVAYPAVLSRRSGAKALDPLLDTAAEIGAQAVGLIVFDNDAGRVRDEIAKLAETAALTGVKVLLEFFGGSSVPSLEAARLLVSSSARTSLGLCVDLLHLVRSGEDFENLSQSSPLIAHAQLCDGLQEAAVDVEEEALHGRVGLGEGTFDIKDFVLSLPGDVSLGLEAPPARGNAEAELDRAARLMVGAHSFMTRLDEAL